MMNCFNMTITLIDPALDAIALDDNYLDTAADAARAYLATVLLPHVLDIVTIDDVIFTPATDDMTSCHEIECSYNT